MKYRHVALVLTIVALAGCNNEKVRNLINERADQATSGLQEAKSPAPPKSYNPLTVSDKIWAGGASLRMRRGVPLPGRYEGARGVALVAGEPMPLNEICSAIGSQTGIPVRIAPGTTGSIGGSSGGGSSGGMTISYEGPLSGLLDQVAGYFGINWKYDGAAINFSRFETRVFMVESLPGTQTVKDGVKEDSGSGGGSSGGSSGGSGTSSLQQTSEMSVELKAWEELKDTVTSMLGGIGNVVTAPSSGTITVTTTPELMRTVSKYIEEENKRSSRQIAINVEVYKVELAQGNDFAFSFNQFLTKWAGFTAPYLGPSGFPLVAGSPLSTTGSNPGELNMAILPGHGGGIQAIFQALSSLGDTTRVAQFPMTTLNNRPVTRRVGRDRAYVASVQNTTTSGSITGSVSSTITPATVREGFALQLTPRLLDDGRIMLQYSLSLTDIVTVREFGNIAAANGVQLPETASRVFVQQSLLKSGNTLVLAGVDDEQTAQNATGVGSPFNFLLGGGSSNVTTHSMLFIAITPQVLDIPRAEQI